MILLMCVLRSSVCILFNCDDEERRTGGGRALPSLVFAAGNAVCSRAVSYASHGDAKPEPTKHVVKEYAEFHAVAASASDRILHHLAIEHIWLNVDEMSR